jgi:hypothetical protein
MPTKVNPTINQQDLEVLYAGASGRSTKFIQGQTPYSPSQVLYRLKKDGIRRMDARNGDTEFSRIMYEKGREIFLQLEMNKLRKKYKDGQIRTPKRRRKGVPGGRKRKVTI